MKLTKVISGSTYIKDLSIAKGYYLLPTIKIEVFLKSDITSRFYVVNLSFLIWTIKIFLE